MKNGAVMAEKVTEKVKIDDKVSTIEK